MKQLYDKDSGLYYIPQMSRKHNRKESTLGMGLTIVIGFMSMAIIVLAVA